VQLVGLAYVLGVFALLRGITGRTPGTAALGLTTVNEQGEPIGVGWALVRMIAGLVDWFPYCIPGLVGLILVLTTRGHRRVGDMAAKSFVVGKDRAGQPVVVPGLSPVSPPVPAPAAPVPPVPLGPPVSTPTTPTTSTTSTATMAPGPPVAPPDPTQPQWDTDRQAYIQWDPVGQRWMQFDQASQQWGPI
jgi:RDD family